MGIGELAIGGLVEEGDVAGFGVPAFGVVAGACHVLVVGEGCGDGDVSAGVEVLRAAAGEMSPALDHDRESGASVDGEAELAEDAMCRFSSDGFAAEPSGKCQDVHRFLPLCD